MNEKIKEEKQEKPAWKAFWVYLAILFVSVLTLYPSLVEQAEVTLEVYEIDDISPELMSLLNMIQPFIIGVGGLLVGHHFAYRVNLHSLVYDKVNLKKPVLQRIKESLPLALILGAVLGIVAIGFDRVFYSYLPELLQLDVPMPQFFSTLSSILYGGIAEEIMLRWGLMTIMVYVFSFKGEVLKNWTYIAAIILSALIFALGHYSATNQYLEMTPIVWVRMLALNGLGGLFFGWLYWKYHLEAAIFSHMFAHITMAVLSLLFALAN